MEAMKRILLIALFLTAVRVNADTIAPKESQIVKPEEKKFGDYFPLIVDARYIYRCTFRSKNVFRALTVKAHDTDDGPIYFFVKDKDLNEENPIIGNNMFGAGAYVKNDDAIYTIRALWMSDLLEVSVSDKMELVKFPLKEGNKTIIHRPDLNQELHVTVADFEEIIVPIGIFPKAVKLDIEEIWTDMDKKYVSHAWLVEDVGVVKFVHPSGRIDVLSSVDFPKGTE